MFFFSFLFEVTRECYLPCVVPSVGKLDLSTFSDILPAASCSRRRLDASAWKAACVTITTRFESCFISSTPWYSRSNSRRRSRKSRRLIGGNRELTSQLRPLGHRQGFRAPPATSPQDFCPCTFPLFFVFVFSLFFTNFFVRLPQQVRDNTCYCPILDPSVLCELTAKTLQILLSV